jgi:hypothetical protein
MLLFGVFRIKNNFASEQRRLVEVVREEVRKFRRADCFVQMLILAGIQFLRLDEEKITQQTPRL